MNLPVNSAKGITGDCQINKQNTLWNFTDFECVVTQPVMKYFHNRFSNIPRC